MSNWCLGCHRTIPKGDFCPNCRPYDKDDEEQDEKRYQEYLDNQKKEQENNQQNQDDEIPF